MRKPRAGLANEVIQRLLELSANAHVQRRRVATDSPAFHVLTGEIAAYGKVLALLTALEAREEFDPIVDQRFSEGVAAVN